MTYFITGATGFIGRHLLEQLVAQRDGTIYVLVRESSQTRLEEIRSSLRDPKRLVPLVGDVTQSKLGLMDQQIEQLIGQVEHFFHLAGSYDMTADAKQNIEINVEGTQHAVELSNRIDSHCFHHISSIVVTGDYKGLFREEDFDVGQKFDHPYQRTKFDSERIAREQCEGRWRVYRPAIVVGHSKTGEMDKIDGPYYFFKSIQKVRHFLPEWFPLVGPELGYTNIVPVDYVVKAIDHIAHLDGLDQQAFHLANPEHQRSSHVLNEFAKAAHAPQITMRVDRKITSMLPKGVLRMAMALPALKEIRTSVLQDLGIPEEIIEFINLPTQFDTRDTERALSGSEIELPPLNSYAPVLWDYWERKLDPDLYKDRSLSGAVRDRTILITGASSGIGKAAALKLARAGGIPLLVARSVERLEETKAEIEQEGGVAFVYPTDLTDSDAVEQLVAEIIEEHGAIDMLVNNAGRSIRRSVANSYDRLHDYERTMRINFFGSVKLILTLLPHMRQRKLGHIVNVSTIGVQTGPPRFSAYVSSKAALDAFTRSIASETIGDNVTFTTIHMPLVKTPMIAPTKMYDSFPTISPDEAADLISEAVRTKPKRIGTRLGNFGEVAYALAPKAVDQIMHMGYRVFPESSAAKDKSKAPEKASPEAMTMAYLMKGIHW